MRESVKDRIAKLREEIAQINGANHLDLHHYYSDSCPLAIAVGTPVARCPPHRPGRPLISASGSYLG
jgi:hypothetical protein